MFLLLIFSILSYSNPLTVVTFDTGISHTSDKVSLCSTGHKNFDGLNLEDVHGHGTNVSAIIQRYAKDSKYCQKIVKFYHYVPKSGITFRRKYLKALSYSIALKPTLINMSLNGEVAIVDEYMYFKIAKKLHVTIVTAAGNDNLKLDIKCKKAFPACYNLSNIIVVGSIDSNKNITQFSNYGEIVDLYYNGINVYGGERYLSGTSQSAAIASGKIIRFLSNNNHENKAKDAIQKIILKEFKVEEGLKGYVKKKSQSQ